MIRFLTALPASHANDRAAVGLFMRQLDVRARLLVTVPRATAQVEQLLALAILHRQSGPDVVSELDPVFRPASRSRSQDERLGSFAVGRVGDRCRVVSACRIE